MLADCPNVVDRVDILENASRMSISEIRISLSGKSDDAMLFASQFWSRWTVFCGYVGILVKLQLYTTQSSIFAHTPMLCCM